MATNKSISATFVTAPFIISYPKLLKPESYTENGKPKGEPMYSFEALSAVDSLSEWRMLNRETGDFNVVNVEAILVSLVKEKFGADFNVREAVKAKTLSWPFKSGDKRAEEKGEKGKHYAGKKIWRAKAMADIKGTPNSPTLYYESGQGLVKITRGTPTGIELINEKFYGGAICSAEVNAVADENAGGGKYATFYVNAVIFEKDGDRLGSGPAVERLRGVRGGQTDYNPTEGMGNDLDDEIPF
jgi:hypothetical protein